MDVGEVLSWPANDPKWVGRLLGMGAIWFLLSLTVIGAIPAAIAIDGWMLQCLDNLRAGRQELASPGLPLRRGARLFLVQLVYLLAILVLTGVFTFAGVEVSKTGSAAALGGGLLVIFGNAISLLGSLALLVFLPQVVLQLDRRGLAGGFDVPAIVRLARGQGSAAVLAGLLSVLALDIISPLGLLFCIVGTLLTTPYAMAVLAAAIQSLDQTGGGSPTASTTLTP